MGGASLLDHPLELNEKLPSRSSEEDRVGRHPYGRFPP
mgnify:FL=1